jgi:hypothetical protein
VARQTTTTLDTWLRNAIETQPYTRDYYAHGAQPGQDYQA